MSDESKIKDLLEKEKLIDEELAHLEQAVKIRDVVMSKLHEYNDIKDATQIVIGTLANLQQVTVRKLHEDFGLDSSE
ncbi:hypothetical protein M8J75_005490 [Diaphorina citri]|nr:hypothetical protein M8J75_005490 [Diaphorina citri]